MKKDTADFKTDLEQLLQEGNIIRLKPQGFSMYPLFIPGRDEALIHQVPVTSLKRNDVALYRRDQGILVLHRIVRVTADGYYMTGDNQYEIEGPLRPDQFRGKLIAFVRNGRKISVRNPVYRFLSALWLLMLPVRPFCFRLTAFLRHVRSKKKTFFPQSSDNRHHIFIHYSFFHLICFADQFCKFLC